MSDNEIDVLNEEKDNNGSNHLASRHKNESRSRRCMDFELHDHLDDNIDDDAGNRKVRHDRSKEEIVKHTETTEVCDFDSDEDTFADADSDCEPNQFFLDEMLEDSHPERLNLMDYRKEDQGKNKGDSSSMLSLSDTENDENDIMNDDNQHKFEDSSTSRHDESDEDDRGRDKVIRTLNVDVDCESTTNRSDEDDSFGNLPTIRNKGKGRQMELNDIGTSAGVGPGRPMLRQASQKAVWGK